MQALPVFDPLAGTLTFNVTIVSDPKYIKFPDGIARLTYAKAVTPSAYARVRVSLYNLNFLSMCKVQGTSWVCEMLQLN